MKYIAESSKLIVDLQLPESERWDRIASKHLSKALKITSQAKNDVQEVSGLSHQFLNIAAKAFGAAYKVAGGLYVEEMRAWADYLGLPTSEIIALNCTYELAHYFDRPLACTAGITWVEGVGMVHARNMDWDLSKIGQATKVIEFRDGDRVFYSVGILGFVGVLSGLLPGGYSVTINWAPPEEGSSFNFAPAFLLRHVLETCDTFDEAVEALSETPVAAPVFYAVCGTRKGEACVVERLKEDAHVRYAKGRSLAQANHYQTKGFLSCNAPIKECEEDEEISLYEDSVMRTDCMLDSLSKLRPGSSLKDVEKVLNKFPVQNDATHQKMVFHPQSGQLLVLRSA